MNRRHSSFDAPKPNQHLEAMSVIATHVDIGGLIPRAPGINNRSPHIVGTSVLVRTIARWHNAGLPPEEFVAKYV